MAAQCDLVLPQLVLASASPRRLAILNSLRLYPVVLLPDTEEITGGQPADLVMTNALDKARAVRNSCPKKALIIGADTIVRIDGATLGKPGDEAEACRMLARLSGAAHQVYSGLALLDNESGRAEVAYSTTRVCFRKLTEAEISSYVRFADPLDKAGAYGIQDGGALLVERIEGDYGTVMGFSPPLFASLLEKFAYNVWQFIANGSGKVEAGS